MGRPSASGVCFLLLAGVALATFASSTPSSVSTSATHIGPRNNGERRRTKLAGLDSSSTTAPILVTYEAIEQYKSQDGQDKWANEHVFHGQVGGVFVDMGCFDGITYSNTWYFERVLNWTGVCVEPNPGVYPRIAAQAGRNSGVQLAVSDHHGSAPFVAAYMRSSLNASAVDYNFLQSQGVNAEQVQVELTTPSALLTTHLPPHTVIDYVNIDVEHLELAILRVWPWSTYCVRLFNIENEPPDHGPSLLPALVTLLQPHGYSHVGRIGVDELFLRNVPCPRTAQPTAHDALQPTQPRSHRGANTGGVKRRRVLRENDSATRRLSRARAKLAKRDGAPKVQQAP